MHSIDTKEKAVQLRRKGCSLNEISVQLHISKSTLSEWLRNILLSSDEQEDLRKRKALAQYKATQTKAHKKLEIYKNNQEFAVHMLKDVQFSKELVKIICSLLWWCEGNKDTGQIRFTNSDPTLMANFLFCMRNGFKIDESKFRALLHLHDYHDEVKQKIYWSTITNIPLEQFYKTYHKPHTGINKHENYQGCLAISYYDAKIAKELEAIYNAFTLKLGGVR